MTKKVALAVMAAAVFFFAGARGAAPLQNPDVTVLKLTITSSQGTHTQCAVSPAGGMSECHAADGFWLSLNGGAYAQVCTVGMAGCGGSSSAGVLTINGAKPGPTGNIALTASIPNVTTTVAAPAASATVGVPALSFASNGAATVGAPTATVSVSAPTATSSSTAPTVNAVGN